MTLPIVLVIDDVYARKVLTKQSFLTTTNTIEISLEDLERGNLPNPASENTPAAYVVFSSGQIDKDEYTFNDYELIKNTIKRNTKYSWSLILLDVMFDSGKIIDGTPQGGQPGDNEFGLKVRQHLLEDFPELHLLMLTTLHSKDINHSNEEQPYLSKSSLQDFLYKLICFGNITVNQAKILLQIGDEIFVDSMDIIRGVYNKAYKAATSPLNANVLLLGETGTGKEIIARYIHRCSTRRSGPFEAINVAALPETLIESELFGIEARYLAANAPAKHGKFEIAHNGFLFLDEIGKMPMLTQDKVLRALQERQICRLGSNQNIDIDVRLLSATSKDIETLIEDNNFSKDLHHRINTVTIIIPPLRERKEEIIPLATSFLNDSMSKCGTRGIILSSEAKAELIQHEFTGNIRELRNLMEYFAIYKSSDEVISDSDIRTRLSLSKVKRGKTNAAAIIPYSHEDVHRSVSDISIPTDAKRSRELEQQIAYLEAKLSARNNSIDNFQSILESISIPPDQEGLQGILPKLNESMSDFLQKVLRNALLATKNHKGKIFPNRAVKLLMNEEIEASPAYDVIKKICKLLNKEPNASDPLVKEALEKGIKNRPPNKKKNSTK